MYILVDTSIDLSKAYPETRNMPMYTGQNREGIDHYVSERYSKLIGRRFAVAGRIDSSKVEVGFDLIGSGIFANIIFEVESVSILKE